MLDITLPDEEQLSLLQRKEGYENWRIIYSDLAKCWFVDVKMGHWIRTAVGESARRFAEPSLALEFIQWVYGKPHERFDKERELANYRWQ